VAAGSMSIRPVAGTVVTRSYRNRAKTIAISFLQCHPQGRFYILTVDGAPSPEPIEGIEWLSPESLSTPHIFELRLRYSPIELCCALKASLARHALEKAGATSFLYLDSDTFVYRPLHELWDALAKAPVLLLPHHVGGDDSSERIAREQAVLPCGVYNAGCFAVRNTREGLAFLAWWEERVRYDCRGCPEEGVFYDQKWLDLARCRFEDIEVFRHPAYDVAYWNLFERPFTEATEGLEVAGQPLAMFHFSGLDLRARRFVPFRAALQVDILEGGVLGRLVDAYVAKVEAFGRDPAGRAPYKYPKFANGVPSDHVFHTLYARLSHEERAGFGDPFQTDTASFFDWAVSPSVPSGISPYFHTVYSLRKDLQSAFPEIEGRDGGAFLDWIMTSGARETGHSVRELRIEELRS
jgi:hypothetical protein